MNKIRPIFTLGFTAALLTGCSSFVAETDGKLDAVEKKVVKAASGAQHEEKFKYFSQISELNLGKFSWGEGKYDRPDLLDARLTYRYERAFPVITALNIISADVGIHIGLDDKAFAFLKGDGESVSEGAGNTVRDTDRSIGFNSEISLNPAALLDSSEEGGSDPSTPGSKPNRNVSKGDLSSRNRLTNEERGDTVVMNMRNVALDDWLDEFTLSRSLFWDWSYIDGKPFITISASMDGSFLFEGITNTATTDEITPAESKTWDELVEFVTDTMTDIGTATFSPSTGRIQVNDRPAAVSKIKLRVDDENKVYNKEILYTVSFVSYSSDQSETFSSDVNSLFDALGESVTFNSAESTATGFTLANDQTADSNATLTALNKITRTAKIKKTVGKAKNRTSFYRTLLGKESIVESLSITTDNDTDQDEFEPTVEDIETGVSINILGTLISNGEISLDISISKDDEIDRTTVEYSDSSITLPNKREDKILSHINLKDGESVVITDSDIATTTSHDRVNADLGWINYLFGGSKTSQDTSTITLLVIKASIIGND